MPSPSIFLAAAGSQRWQQNQPPRPAKTKKPSSDYRIVQVAPDTMGKSFTVEKWQKVVWIFGQWEWAHCAHNLHSAREYVARQEKSDAARKFKPVIHPNQPTNA